GDRGLIKLNPLFDWTRDRLMTFVAANNIPINPLHAQGFASIGCAPCTRRVLEGEDSRAGRWSGSEKTECGIHFGFVDGAGI
ncbi:MAG TPA: phosphoadenosine phosphosulfate reductase family protein, partial [Dongiaceae bacterium]